jgi:two-component system cell cycle sensor histidine kinase/response regulator CckA
MNNLLHNERLMAWEDRVETILLVEDEDFVRNVTRKILRAAGYRVLAAGDSAAADRRFDEFGTEVDLLLTDMILPGENGAELAAKMRQQNPALKVLFVTGYADQIAALKNAGEECLLKPFCTEVLLRRVGELMGRPRTHGAESFMRACVGA